MGLEGIVSKRAESIYCSGRTLDWLKIKSFAEATFDIVGVQREPRQPAMALTSDHGRYVGRFRDAAVGRAGTAVGTRAGKGQRATAERHES